MSSVPRYEPRYSYEDYLQWSGDWELWNGNAVAMTPSPFAPHERIVARFVQTLRNQIDEQECDCEVYAGLDWVVASDTVVRPDVMVVCGHQPAEHLRSAPSLIVEVLSPSTESKDRNEKRSLYERQGVEFYLLADPQECTLEAYRLVGERLEPLEMEHDAAIELSVECHFKFDIESLVRD